MDALFKTRQLRANCQWLIIVLFLGMCCADMHAQTGPVITQNPVATAVNVGGVATFTAAASGDPTPTVQWQATTSVGGSFIDLPGATGTNLSFTATASLNGIHYRAVFSNSSGTVMSSAALLVVLYPPSITVNPTNQSVPAGGLVTFLALATANPAPTVQWQISHDGGTTFADMVGQTFPTLGFYAQFSDNNAQVRAVFSNTFNGAATATTTAATITILFAPIIIVDLPAAESVNVGRVASFQAEADGNPTPSVKWQVSTDGGASFSDMAEAPIPLLSFLATASEDGKRYRAVFSNSVGTATTTATLLTVHFSPVVTLNPSNQIVVSGSTATFAAAAAADPAPTVFWQVSVDGGTTFNGIPGSASPTYSFTAQLADSGNQYRAVFANSFNGGAETADTAAAILTVISLPQITQLAVTGTDLDLTGTNVQAGSYVLVASTNLTTLLAQWISVLTNTFGADASFSVVATNLYSKGVATKFYRYRTP